MNKCVFICKLLVFIALFVFCACVHRTQAGCVSLPVSVSNIKDCKDNYCSMDVIYSGSLDVATQKVQCLELYLEKRGVLSSLNITLTSAFATQPVKYCYYTDDPLYSTRAACGCAASSQTQCALGCSYATPDFGDNNLCYSATAFGSGACNATNPIVYCAKTGFSALKRIKVCKLNPKSPMKAVIRVDTETQSQFWEMNAGQFSSNDENFFFQFSNTEFETIGDVPYYVVDLNSPYNLWFGSDSLVNDLSSYDYTKIGWYKKGSTVEVDKTKLATAVEYTQYAACTNYAQNSAGVAATYKFIMPTEIMKKSSNYYAINVEPNAFISDSEVEVAQANNKPEPSSTGTEFWQMKDGFFGYGYMTVAKIVFVGLGVDGNYIPSLYTVLDTSFPVFTSRDRTLLTTWNLHCSYAWLKDKCGQVCVAETPNSPGEYGFCVVKHCEKTFSASSLQCTDVDFDAVSWPSQQIARYRFQGSKGLVVTYSTFDNSNNTLYIPARKASLSYTLTMRNVPIKFVSLDVRPVIKSCILNGNKIDIEMKSEAAEGQSIATMSPGIFASQSFYLSREYSTYYYPVSQSLTSGVFDITVRVGDFSVSCKVNLSSNTTIEFNWKNITGIPYNFLGLLSGSNMPITPDVSSMVFWTGLSLLVLLSIIVFVVGIYIIWSCCCVTREEALTKRTELIYNSK